MELFLYKQCEPRAALSSKEQAQALLTREVRECETKEKQLSEKIMTIMQL